MSSIITFVSLKLEELTKSRGTHTMGRFYVIFYNPQAAFHAFPFSFYHLEALSRTSVSDVHEVHIDPAEYTDARKLKSKAGLKFRLEDAHRETWYRVACGEIFIKRIFLC